MLKNGSEVDARPYLINEKDHLVIKHANAYSSCRGLYRRRHGAGRSGKSWSTESLERGLGRPGAAEAAQDRHRLLGRRPDQDGQLLSTTSAPTSTTGKLAGSSAGPPPTS